MNEFFTWELLGTYAGVALATGVVTQFIKGLFSKLPTQALAYVVALILLLAGAFFTGGLSASAAVMAFFNAALVATATSGSYDAFQRFKGGE